MKLIGKRFYLSIFLEVAMAAGFIAIAVLLPLWWGMLAYFLLFLVYCALHYKTIARSSESSGAPCGISSQVLVFALKRVFFCAI